MDEVFQRFLRQSGPVLSDIGSVTQDVVLARSGVDTENWPRFVLPSPSQTIAQRIRELTLLRRDVWLYGAEMGGNFAPAVESCLKSGRLMSTPPGRPLIPFHRPDPAMVRQMGVVSYGSLPGRMRARGSPGPFAAVLGQLSAFRRHAPAASRARGRSGSRYSFPRQQQGFRAGSISRNSCRRRHRPSTG